MLGDDLNEGEVATFESVLDGSMLSALQDLKSKLADLRQTRIDYSFKPGANASVLKQMDSGILSMQNSLNTAIQSHNKIAGWIQTATGQNVGLAGMRGMAALGVIPAIVYTVAVIAGSLIALALVLDELAKAFAAAQGKYIETKGVVEQFSDVASSAGGAIGKTSGLVLAIGGVAAAGVGLYFLFKVLKRRGVLA
jgi:hypothetical protein